MFLIIIKSGKHGGQSYSISTVKENSTLSSLLIVFGVLRDRLWIGNLEG